MIKFILIYLLLGFMIGVFDIKYQFIYHFSIMFLESENEEFSTPEDISSIMFAWAIFFLVIGWKLGEKFINKTLNSFFQTCNFILVKLAEYLTENNNE